MKNGILRTLSIALLCVTLGGCMCACPAPYGCCHQGGCVPCCCEAGCGHGYVDGGEPLTPSPVPDAKQKSQRPGVPMQEKPPRPPPLKQGYRKPSQTDRFSGPWHNRYGRGF